MDTKKFDRIIKSIRKEATAKGGYILHEQVNELLGDDVDVLFEGTSLLKGPA